MPAVPAAVPASIDLNVSPDAPIVVPSTLSAVPLVVASVLFAPVRLTVPPPVALKALLAPLLTMTPPVKLIVAPVFKLRLTPVPVSLIAPLNATVPPLRPATETEWPPLTVIGDAMVMLPLAAPERSTPSPAVFEMLTAVVVPMSRRRRPIR